MLSWACKFRVEVLIGSGSQVPQSPPSPAVNTASVSTPSCETYPCSFPGGRGSKGMEGQWWCCGDSISPHHCFPFISVRGTHTHTTLSHTNFGTKAVWSWSRKSLSWGAGGSGCGCPPPLGLVARGEWCCAWGQSVTCGCRLTHLLSWRHQGCPPSVLAGCSSGCRVQRRRSPVHSERAGPGVAQWRSRALEEGAAAEGTLTLRSEG